MKRVEHKLIQTGSLFGTFRVVPDLLENQQHLKFIKEHLVNRNAILTKLAARIVDKIGGAGNFIGLHMRVGDGFFMRTARMTLDRMYHTIIDARTNLSPDVVDKLEGGTHNQDVLEDETVDLNKRMIKSLESEKFEVATNDVFPDSTKTHRAVVPIACPKCNATRSWMIMILALILSFILLLMLGIILFYSSSLMLFRVCSFWIISKKN